MSVKCTSSSDKIILELDNGDCREFLNAISKWNFKDEESLIRFALSLLMLTENKYFQIKVDRVEKPIKPAPHLLRDVSDEEK